MSPLIDQQAERDVLGQLVADRWAASRVLRYLEETWFSAEPHRAILRAIRDGLDAGDLRWRYNPRLRRDELTNWHTHIARHTLDIKVCTALVLRAVREAPVYGLAHRDRAGPQDPMSRLRRAYEARTRLRMS